MTYVERKASRIIQKAAHFGEGTFDWICERLEEGRSEKWILWKLDGGQ